MAHGKRSRQQAESTSVSLLDLDSGDMARILLLFSGHHQHHAHYGPSSPERVFECKTCNRRFPSFQALGGHRASHKKPRLADGAGAEPPKPKVHGCSICGLEFAVGQALGGHMRRHRAVAAAGAGVGLGLNLGLGLGLGLRPNEDGNKKAAAAAAELALDLNEPALEEEPADRAMIGLAVGLPVVVDFRG